LLLYRITVQFIIGIRMARFYMIKSLEYFQINPGESGNGR
jgi:hypothetical protein